MLYELFLTLCTNGTLIMIPFIHLQMPPEDHLTYVPLGKEWKTDGNYLMDMTFLHKE